MINTRELRIGNYVQDKKSWIKVGSIDEDIVDKAISPIPLTPEILEKCGFEFGVNENGVYYIDLNGIDQQLEIVLSGNDFYPQIAQAPEMSSEDCQIVSLKSIQYLHQLQNLYFAFTGKELEIKL